MNRHNAAIELHWCCDGGMEHLAVTDFDCLSGIYACQCGGIAWLQVGQAEFLL